MNEDIIYQEPISKDLAKRLLGGSFKEGLEYQLITDPYSTTVVAYDNSVPHDHKNYRTEYLLEEEEQSYSEEPLLLHVDKPAKKKSINWFAVTICVLLVLIVVSIILHLYVV